MILRRRIMVGKGGGEVEYVDLGLPSGLLWATCNIGANSPEEIGMYFSYANVEGHYYGDGYSFSGANYNASPGAALPKTSAIPANATYDAAVAVLGAPWRMPSKAEYSELNSNCNHTWTTINGVSGMLFTSKISGYTDKSVFFPASGRWANASQLDTGTNGRYYYSDNTNAEGVYSLFLTNNTVTLQDSNGRSLGFNIRGVCNIYYPGKQGAFVYDIRGKFYTADEWSDGIADGSLDNDDVVGVAVISGEHRFVIDKTDANSGNTIKFGGYLFDLSGIGVVCSNDSSVASLDFDGAGNTTKIISALAGYTDSYDTTGAPAAEACRAAFNGTGYLGALGEWALVYDNKNAINSLLTLIGGTMLSTARYKTSTLYNASAASWRLRMSNKAMEERNRYNEDLVRAFKAI